jgi:quercetin dioxygenase-like cupin family protein
MNVFKSDAVSSAAGDANTFVGSVRTKALAASEAGTPVKVYRVEFEDGARTNWHRHTGPQWLLIVEGRVRVQKAGEPAVEVEAGDAVVIDPGEKHWHGAAPGGRGAHIAVNVNAATEWLEPVSDADYRAGVAVRRHTPRKDPS